MGPGYAFLAEKEDRSGSVETVDHPEEYACGCHVVLEDGQVVTVRWD